MDFNNEKYEYRTPKELESDKAKYLFVPMSLIEDTELYVYRVALFAYLAMYRGLNNRVVISIPRFVEWAGFKSDTHSRGINEKVLVTLDMLNDLGYLTYCEQPTKSNIAELVMDMNFVTEECANDFAILYIDEVEKIMSYKRANLKDAHLNSFSVLLVFAYLRRKIFRRPNLLKPEERTQEGIEERRKRIPEAYTDNYKDIGEALGLSERTVSKAVRILEELNLIVVAESYHHRMDGVYRTSYVMFANHEKREKEWLLDSGLEYAHREMELKEQAMEKYTKNYTLKKPWKEAS